MPIHGFTGGFVCAIALLNVVFFLCYASRKKIVNRCGSRLLSFSVNHLGNRRVMAAATRGMETREAMDLVYRVMDTSYDHMAHVAMGKISGTDRVEIALDRANPRDLAMGALRKLPALTAARAILSVIGIESLMQVSADDAAEALRRAQEYDETTAMDAANKANALAALITRSGNSE